MTSRRASIVLRVVCAAVMLAPVGRFALEAHFAARFPGFPSAPPPSLRLALLDACGLRPLHAQFGQDAWVLDVVYPGLRDGVFVDVGAGDAVLGSNTEALEQAGWTGFAVDPFPTGDWDARRATLLREVVSDAAGERVTFRAAGSLGGIERSLGRWREHDAVRAAGNVELVTTTLRELLGRVGAPGFVHFVSVDTEGSELAVLRGFPFERVRVGAWTIEHNGEEPKRGQIRELLASHGYRFVRQQVVDDFFVADDPAFAHVR